MACLPLFDLPGIPQHIVQRGNNRLPCFLDEADRRHYLHLLREALFDSDCALHAYVLMDNHVHLLATPPATGAISRLMQKLGWQYVGQFNARHRRTGTLWEGRYKSCMVDSKAYLLQCARYIDLNPVRARMIDDPKKFPWSSCAALCGQHDDPLLTLHHTQRALGTCLQQRGDAYRALLRQAIADDELLAIRTYLQQQRVYGRDDFRTMVEAKTRRFAGVRPAHGPRKQTISE